MTRAERRALEAAYRSLMAQSRLLAARASRDAIRTIDGLVLAAGRDFRRITTSDNLLSYVKAKQMMDRVRRSLARIEAEWIATAQTTQATIISGILAQHSLVHLEASRVVGLNGKGIALKLKVVPKIVKPRAVKALRSGKATTAAAIRDHMTRVEQGFAAYLQEVTGVKSSAEALRGMQQLLNGRLPFGLSGDVKSEVRAAASLGWKSEQMTVTESFATYRETNAEGLKVAPVTMVAQWLLSDRHEVPDECDDLASADMGYGPGMYPPEDWPDAPHPNCQCGQGDVQIVED